MGCFRISIFTSVQFIKEPLSAQPIRVLLFHCLTVLKVLLLPVMLQKEDNTQAKVDEALDFKVIEFSKENKKIILSHSQDAPGCCFN